MSAFEWIKPYHVFKENKNQYVLFHYPILEWEGFYQNSILLYGHVHNHKVSYFNEMLGPYAVNVGADLITLASMLRIPVTMHNVEKEKVFRPHSWASFGTQDVQAADYAACKNYGPLY